MFLEHILKLKAGKGNPSEQIHLNVFFLEIMKHPLSSGEVPDLSHYCFYSLDVITRAAFTKDRSNILPLVAVQCWSLTSAEMTALCKALHMF